MLIFLFSDFHRGLQQARLLSNDRLCPHTDLLSVSSNDLKALKSEAVVWDLKYEVKCSILVSPMWPSQSPDGHSDLSPGSTSSAAARSNNENRKVPLRPLKTLLQTEDVGISWFGKRL